MPQQELSAKKKKHILVVEDNPNTQKLACAILKRHGYMSTVAADGEKAVKALLEEDYDLVLMDMQMPVLDGYQATKKIRAFNTDVPIVAVTAHALSNDRHKCLKAGCDDYIAKPFDQESLMAIIKNNLDKKNPPAEKPTPSLLGAAFLGLAD